MLRNLIVGSINLIVALAVVVAGYEIVHSLLYEGWRSEHENSVASRTGLTMASSDPVLLWEYRPERKFVHPEFRTVTETNEHGFRERSGVAFTPPAGTRRLAFVGDSVTLGREVRFEQVFSQVAEALLNGQAESGRYEALNFGVDGYNTPQIQRQLMTKVFRFSPDLVIYALCLNDFDFEEASGQKIRYFKKPKSFLLEDLARVSRALFADDYHSYHFSKNKEAVFEAIAAMNAAAEKRGVGFVILVIPVFEADPPSPLGLRRPFRLESFEDYHLSPLHDEIVRELGARGVAAVDVLPRFSDSGLAPAAFAFDHWHLNARGHEVVGQAVADLVLRSDTFAPTASPLSSASAAPNTGR